ncbi:hypothetical protein H0H92_013658 [Tricholoma furcatifolium]|nr:hypothetical protein H0H92_013658 [Tricholoma furcatifolium]
MSDLLKPAPPPPTKLGVYRQLSTTAGVHVSPLALGAMSIGDKWSSFMGSMDKESSYKLLDAYYNAGGNFIDTANNYQSETSEIFIGDCAAERGIRDQLFIATKYTAGFKLGNSSVAQQVHYVGNSVKAMHISVNASLKKLRTDYIDLLYVHWWDWETSIEEIMRGLHVLVMAGKVLYLVWRWPLGTFLHQANSAPTPKRRHVVSGEEGRKMMSNDWERNEKERKVSAVLEKVANEVGTKQITAGSPAVAIAYLLHKAPYVFPIIGGRKIEHLYGNIEALDISLTQDQIKYLESVVEFDIGFPGNFVGVGDTQPLFKRIVANYAPIIHRQPIQVSKPQ